MTYREALLCYSGLQVAQDSKGEVRAAIEQGTRAYLGAEELRMPKGPAGLIKLWKDLLSLGATWNPIPAIAAQTRLMCSSDQ